jgi:hypothetical protein
MIWDSAPTIVTVNTLEWRMLIGGKNTLVEKSTQLSSVSTYCREDLVSERLPNVDINDRCAGKHDLNEVASVHPRALRRRGPASSISSEEGTC